MTFLLFIFYLMLLCSSLAPLNFKVSDDSQMKQCKDLDDYYVGREGILRNLWGLWVWLVGEVFWEISL